MSLNDVELHLVDDFETAQELISWLGTRDCSDVLGVDTETTGLDLRTDRPRTVQVGGRVHGWLIPLDEWRGLWREVLARYEGRYVLHNAPFDDVMLRHLPAGLQLPRERVLDTRPMSHIITPNVGTALKTQTALFVDATAAAAQSELDTVLSKGGWTWATVPTDFGPYWRYGALDPVLTVHLYDHHWPLIAAQGAVDAYDLESAVQWVTLDMQLRGTHIDRVFTEKTLEAFETYVARTGTWVKDSYGVGAGSNDEIVKILQREGVNFEKLTESGKFSLDKEVLEGIDHPLANAVLSRRRLQKLASTYLRNFLRLADENDNIHPSINTLGARTGRMSMSEPNLQNLPRKSEHNLAANAVRNCIVARPDHALIMCDFDQIEMRLLAHLSNDPGLIRAFHAPDDFFVTLGREMYHDPTLVKGDPRRQIVKNAGYSEIYGAGVAKFAQTAGITEDEARAVKQRWNELYAGTKIFSRTVESFAWSAQRQDGYPWYPSPITGRRHVADTNKIYALLNYLIQGGAAELFKQKILQLSAAGLSRWMIIPVHDEIILDVPLDRVDEVVTVLRDVMNDDSSFSVPITASVAAGDRWGTKADLMMS